MKLTNFQTAIIGVLVTVTIAAVVALEVANRDVDSLIYLLGVILIPTVTSLFGVKAANEAKETAEQTQKDMTEVHTLVNGNTSRLLDLAESNGHDITAERAQFASRQVPTSNP